MRDAKFLSLFFYISLTVSLSAQNKSQKIKFYAVNNLIAIKNSDYFKINGNDSIKIDELKFYISNIQFLKDTEVLFQEINSYHLVDIFDSSSINIDIPKEYLININKIKFNLGIDSITNVSGVFGGDLDPTKGMYWTWQNGYINFKLEGKSNICKSSGNEFIFHLGGYQNPFSAFQTINLDLPLNCRINIYLDLSSLLSYIDLGKQNHIMSPGESSKIMSTKVANSFFTNLKQ